MSNPIVCSYKPECNRCLKVEVSDRPDLCLTLRCNKYTPCNNCGQNRYLNSSAICAVCESAVAKAQKKVTKEDNKAELQRIADAVCAGGLNAIPTNPDIEMGRLDSVSMTLPGNPPLELTEEEKEYYRKRWQDYKGYYRDPIAFITCHSLILEEISLNFVQGVIARTRGEAQEVYMRKKDRIISTMGDLKRQLPEKESLDLSDDEKAIGRIYEAYVKEVGAMRHTGIDRILTGEALALIPILPHKIDIGSVLRRLGYSPIDIDSVVEKIKEQTVDRNIDETVEFFGFTVGEKYALPYNDALNDDDNTLAESLEQESEE